MHCETVFVKVGFDVVCHKCVQRRRRKRRQGLMSSSGLPRTALVYISSSVDRPQVV